ncbi:MAG: apolipoprotein N-acyltransferase [Opitutales bacterium]|nr:apolipoprotein N-acyltransferase [Opitutales bacterium]
MNEPVTPETVAPAPAFPFLQSAKVQIAIELFLSISTGLLYALCFPSRGVPEAAYVFALPLLCFFMLRPESWKPRMWTVLPGGFIGWVCLIFWLRHVTWMGMLGLSLVLSVFWAVWFCAAAKVIDAYRNKMPLVRISANLGLAGLWVLLEWLRSWVFTGFPWLPLAASQWERSALLQIIAYTGAWGLSFMLIFFNLGISYYIKHLFTPKRRKAWYQKLNPDFYAAMGLLFLTFCFMFEPGFFHKRNRREIMFTAAAVQPATEAMIKWNPEFSWQVKEDLERYTTLAAKFDPDVILWPEAATPWPILGMKEPNEWITGFSHDLGIPLMMGSIAVEGDVFDKTAPWYNMLTVVDPKTGIAPYYGKRHLVPFGEYVPFQRWLPFIKKVVPIGEYVAASRNTIVPLRIGFKEYKVGGLVCYEDVFPQLARENVLNGADFHYVVTNGIWYGEEGMNLQHMAHSVLRAVETRRPVVRCGNNGWSGWIDEYGNVCYELIDADGSTDFSGLDTFEVQRDPLWSGKLSLYARNGDWFVLFSFGIMLFSGFMLRYIPDEREEIKLSGREKARRILANKKIGR